MCCLPLHCEHDGFTCASSVANRRYLNASNRIHRIRHSGVRNDSQNYSIMRVHDGGAIIRELQWPAFSAFCNPSTGVIVIVDDLHAVQTRRSILQAASALGVGLASATSFSALSKSPESESPVQPPVAPTTDAQLSTADILVETLIRWDVQFVFGIAAAHSTIWAARISCSRLIPKR
jgi:hypothetical protein